MSITRRVIKLEEYRAQRAQGSGTLFEYTDDDGVERCEVMVSGVGIVPYADFLARYPDGGCDLKLVNVNPHWL